MSNPVSVALRSFLLLALLQAGAAALALPSMLRSTEREQDRARRIDAAETKAAAACAGHIDLIPGTDGELVSDYRCTRAILHVCRVAGDTGPAMAFAVMLHGESGFDTYDPERLLMLPSPMGLLTATWPRSISFGIPPYLGEGPHQEVYEDPGDRGGRIDLVYLGAAKARSTITIIHFREPPAGHTTIFKGRCSVTTGASAIRRFRKLEG